jgi:MFS family permease
MTVSPLSRRVPSSGGPLSLIADDGFRRVWLSGSLVGTVRWIEFLAVGVYVFEVTGSAALVAVFTMLRMAPMPLLGAVAGVLAERVSPRRLLLLVLGCGIAVTAIQGVLAWAGVLALWHVGVGVLVSGVFWAFDMPLRRTMLGELAGPGRTAAAMGLDSATNNATRMLGPGVGGLLMELVGIQGAFLLCTFLYAVGYLLLSGLRWEAGAERGGPFRIGERILDGFRIVIGDRALIGTLAVTVVFNVFVWPVTSMVPVIGKEHLQLSAFPVGLLMSADGFGALLGAVVVATRVKPPSFRGLYLLGVAVFAACSIGFALSPWPVLAGLAQLLAGLGGVCFATMQATIVFLSAPAAARARVMGLLSVCIGSAMFGFLHLSVLAGWLGAQATVVVSSAEGLLALALCVLIWPEIRPRAAFTPR